MVKLRLKNMDLDELWRLHEELTKILAEKITGEKLELENRLAQFGRFAALGDAGEIRTQPSTAPSNHMTMRAPRRAIK